MKKEIVGKNYQINVTDSTPWKDKTIGDDLSQIIEEFFTDSEFSLTVKQYKNLYHFKTLPETFRDLGNKLREYFISRGMSIKEFDFSANIDYGSGIDIGTIIDKKFSWDVAIVFKCEDGNNLSLDYFHMTLDSLDDYFKEDENLAESSEEEEYVLECVEDSLENLQNAFSILESSGNTIIAERIEKIINLIENIIGDLEY